LFFRGYHHEEMPHITCRYRTYRHDICLLCCTYTSPATGQLQASGTVSATGASNLSDLEDKLAEKAKEQGAKGFVVNSAGGKNQMYGTATIYK
jgi:MqsR-controlled colanic acid and biofilm protein A